MPKKDGSLTVFEILAAGKKKGYRYNGCTMSPDFHWKTCCDLHDYDYQDLTKSRLNSDNDLAVCMWKKKGIGGKFLAPVYWIMVRIFGSTYYKRKQNESLAKIGTPDDPAKQPDWMP